jgi:predicted ATP-grasp superfamily ATP-dependent carboligase
MSLIAFASDLELADTTMVLAMSGWVDAASVSTNAAERIAEGGRQIAAFDPDALFDYRSSRPVMHFTSGELTEIAWPRLEVFHRGIDGVDFVIVKGHEPDFRWKELTTALAEVARKYGVTKLVTLGAVPAQMPHTRPVRVVCTTSHPELLLDGDEVLDEDLVVPGAAVSALRHGMGELGFPAIGYWAQVPFYLPQFVHEPFHAASLSLLERVEAHTGVHIPVDGLADDAAAQIDRLNTDIAANDEARRFVSHLEHLHDNADDDEESPPVITFDDMISADEIGEQVERFLRSTSDDD